MTSSVADRLTTRPRMVASAVRWVLLAGVASATIGAASASAAMIPGDPLQIYMDGSAHMQVRFKGYAEGELKPGSLDLSAGSGMTFTNYTPGAAAMCGAAGNPVTPVSGPTAVTGSGTVASPYEMSTTYTCELYGSRIDITQTFSYVNGETDFLARFAITNPGASDVRFRATSRGVFTMGGSAQGQGFLDSSAPRTIGAFNDEHGSAGGFVETASTPWSRYVEGPPSCHCTTFTNEDDTFGEGLTSTIDPSLVTDPRVAVQFDRYTSFGLAPGASDTFAVQWFFDHYGGLSLTPQSGSQSVGKQQSVTAVSRDHGQPVNGAVVRYTITGANAASGSVSTAGDGTATIGWLGSQPGQDTLTAYVDNDGDGAFDPSIDTRQVATFSWTAPPSPAAAPAPPPPPPPAAAPPSNRFSVIAANARPGGIIVLTLRAPVAGAFRAVATSRRSANRTFPYGSARASAKPARNVKLIVKPTALAKRRIGPRGLRVRIAVTFKPTGGTARTSYRTMLVKRRPRG